MDELLFCNNCGKVRMSSVNKIGDKCLTCETGTFIGTGIDYDMAYVEVIEEYKKAHNGATGILETLCCSIFVLTYLNFTLYLVPVAG